MAKLQTHVDDDFASYIRDEAERRDISVSEHIKQILKHHHHQENLDEELQKTDAERRIEELVTLAKDEITKTSEWQKEVMVRGSVNQIALWELAKREYSWSDHQRRQALSIGASRLREPLAELGVQIDEIDGIADDPDLPADTDDAESHPWQNVGDDE